MKQIELAAFQEAVKDLGFRGMVVYQDGEKLVHCQARPEERQNQYSVTKSFTSTAVGFAVQEGRFCLDDYVLEHFREDAPDHPAENLKKMKLRHLLTMSMGFESPMLMGAMRPKMTEKDWVKYVLGARVVHEPGTCFQYNNAGPYLLGILVQRKAGCSLMEYLGPRLWGPLGIPVPVCELDPLGNTFGAGGLRINVSELAKFGLFCLNRGKWNGSQLLSEAWFDQAVTPQIEADEGDEEIGRHYACLFWTMPDGMYRADGKYGQYCVVYPKKRAVIAVNSMETEREKEILRAVVRTIVPQL